MSVSFVERQRAAKRLIEEIVKKNDRVFIIHYSCESFYDSRDGRTPRITSIACRNLGTGQTRSFSIHQVSELPKFHGKNIEENFDEIERELLDEYFQFVSEHLQHAYWVHWNMRDINYGFPAIEHRYRVLGGVPVQIQDDRKLDLARALIDRYGKKYAGHPRLESIMEINLITSTGFLSGKDEAYAYKDREFLKLHQSTLRKTDVIVTLLEATAMGRLKTQAPFWDRYGGSVRLVWEKFIWTPFGRIVTFILGLLALVEWFWPEAKLHFSTWIQGLIGG